MEGENVARIDVKYDGGKEEEVTSIGYPLL